MAKGMAIGELSSRSGVSQSALRFYERRGLISSRRTEGNQRRFDASMLRRVALVQAARAAGIPLERVRGALDGLPDGKAPTTRDWERLSRGWRREIDERIATLESVRDRLTTCIGCGCLSLRSCSLLNPADEAGRLGPGARYLRATSTGGDTPPAAAA